MRSAAMRGHDRCMVTSIDISEIRRATGWSPIRRELGVMAFGINAWSADDGGQLVGEHDESTSGHEELYVVLTGAARFTVDGDDLGASAGTIVFVRDPSSTRAAIALEDGTTILSVGGKAGEAYAPRVWEVSAEVIALFEQDRILDAKVLMLGALDEFDGHWIIHYNLACADARLGEPEPAFEHLREALEKRPQLADNAKDDPDLESLHDDARFDEILGAVAS